jgi:Ca-activated chloride channel family protein
LEQGTIEADAVWPANAIWLTMGDRKKLVKDEQSVFWTPVVFGVKRPVAEELGWVGKRDVRVADILAAAERGRMRFMMTSATQSNSGASAYLGFLYAFAGQPSVLRAADVEKDSVQDKVRRILSKVNRSSGSSGWLKDLFLERYDAFDAMVNYEAVVMEANRELERQGRDPLYVVYPSDGLAISDAPLGYVERGDAAKRAVFAKLQAYLLGDEGRRELVALGRRVGPVSEPLAASGASVFRAEWGVRTDGFGSQIRYPAPEVIRAALAAYQTSLRKPSYTVYCLDYSGSMQGDREQGLKTAMRLILDQTAARRSFLQASKRDVTVVIPFSHEIKAEWRVTGNDRAALTELWSRIDSEMPNGGTDIYTPVMRAMAAMEAHPGIEDFFPAVILLSDGESNRGPSLDQLRGFMRQRPTYSQIPVFSIKFGEASSEQLDDLARTTSGRVFDGSADLAHAFREAKGYN